MATGWIYTDGHYQYLNEFGIQQFGWVLINGHSHYFDPDGNAHEGILIENGKEYMLNHMGALLHAPNYVYLGIANYTATFDKTHYNTETVSLYTALEYKGYINGITLEEFGNGIIYADNPNEGYCNNHMFPPALVSWGSKYAGNKIVDLTNQDVNSLFREIDAGNPVLAYLEKNYHSTAQWAHSEYGYHPMMENVVVLDGYDLNTNSVHISDSINGPKWISLDQFSDVYNIRKFAVAVQ